MTYYWIFKAQGVKAANKWLDIGGNIYEIPLTLI